MTHNSTDGNASERSRAPRRGRRPAASRKNTPVGSAGESSRQASPPAGRGALALAATLVWAEPEAGAAAAAKLLKNSSQAVRELVAALHEGNDETTVQASFALDAMAMASAAPGQEAARAALAKNLAAAIRVARDDVARNVVIHYLQQIGTDDAVPALARCLEQEATFDTALLALRQIGTEKAFGAILNRLSRVTGRQRACLAAALGDADDPCCHPEIPGVIAKVLSKASADDAPMIWVALARLGHVGLLDTLIAALKGPSRSRAAVARGCLAVLAGNCEAPEDVTTVITEFLKAEPRTISGLMAFQDNLEEETDTVPYLLELLPEQNRVLRETLVNVLGEGYPGSSVTELLIAFYHQQASQEGQNTMETRRALLRILGRRADLTARPFLMSRLHDADAAIREAALAAVENLVGPLDRKALAATVMGL